MFGTVVVGADDSVTARRAVSAAAGIAKMSGATLHIVSVYRLKNFDVAPALVEQVPLHNEGEVDALLQDLEFLAKAEGVDPVIHKVGGSPADSLLMKADELHADLVVVGNRGMKGARRILGSVPNSVAHGANCSVAIIDTTD